MKDGDGIDLFAFITKQKPESKPETVANKNPKAALPLPVGMIREALEIDEAVPSGLRWKIRPRHHFERECDWKTWNTRFSGQFAGRRMQSSIYWQVCIGGGRYCAHRIVFLLANGFDPAIKSVDHIRADLELPNIASNLRLALHRENLRNQKKRRDNTSGTTGVRLNKKTGKWEAFIAVDYKHVHLGCFTIYEDSVAARKEAEVKYFGSFAFSASQKINLKTPQ